MRSFCAGDCPDPESSVFAGGRESCRLDKQIRIHVVDFLLERGDLLDVGRLQLASVAWIVAFFAFTEDLAPCARAIAFIPGFIVYLDSHEVYYFDGSVLLL